MISIYVFTSFSTAMLPLVKKYFFQVKANMKQKHTPYKNMTL